MYELTAVSDNEFEDLLGQRANLVFYSDGIGFNDLVMKPRLKVENGNTLIIYTLLNNKFVFRRLPCDQQKRL